MNTYRFNPSLIYDIWVDEIEDPFDSDRWNLATKETENEWYHAYGFKSISFTHVLLSKLFLLPILFVFFIFLLLVSFCMKCAVRHKITEAIFLFFKYMCFFNLPIWYMIEMYQDLIISALVNIWLLGKSESFTVILVVNIALACLFLFLTFCGVLALLIYFCTKIWRTVTKKPATLYETFASFSPRSYPWIMHLLIFSISWFLMALFVCL